MDNLKEEMKSVIEIWFEITKTILSVMFLFTPFMMLFAFIVKVAYPLLIFLFG